MKEFTADDLQPDRLSVGARQTLSDFYQWRDSHPGLVAEHIDYHTELLGQTVAEYDVLPRLGRKFFRSRRETFEQVNREKEIGFFCVYNLAELPSPDEIHKFYVEGERRKVDYDELVADSADHSLVGMMRTIDLRFPELRDTPEARWLGEQMGRLYRILPDSVIQEGGMGKAARTLTGVLVIGALDTMDEPMAVRTEHLTHILPAAYAYGAMYPIIDDTLQDSHYVDDEDRQRYHEAILKGIRTGEPIDTTDMPDHPLAEELLQVYDMMLDAFPHRENKHLYSAGESMYLAQDRDSRRQPGDGKGGITSLYPDMFMKASMTRVVANILGRRTIPADYYARSININFINQLRDDFGDYRKDTAAGRLTPFTYPQSSSEPNPLYDLFAYSAYIAHKVFDNEPRPSEILTFFSAARLAVYMLRDPALSARQASAPGVTSEMRTFINKATRLSPKVSTFLQRDDIKLETVVGNAFKNRKPTETDPRTFISDRLDYINDVIREQSGRATQTRLDEMADYVLEAGGKRLRPALTLMLAESLRIPYEKIKPLLGAIERLHTASLVFDDLPAQDNASMRRGKPTLHHAYDEAGAQLTGISLVSSGFGLLAELGKQFPAEKVNEVISYFGSVLGPERVCLGQDLDLHYRAGADATDEEILETYKLKTSSMIEAALMPLMMLSDRPQVEREHIVNFASHAGIVFQLRDDILDAVASAGQLGKDVDGDLGKLNIVRIHGLQATRDLMEEHLRSAVAECQTLPFDTKLLERMVEYFAARNK